MADRNWDQELARIDRQLESVSDAALFPSAAKASPAERQAIDTRRAGTRTWGAFLRLALSVAVGVGIVFWPYPARCGLGLGVYLLAVAGVLTGGVWSAIWTWKHRTPRAHALSLLVVAWSLVLGAIELLPRTGYALPTAAHPAAWICPS
ncbi:MAG: hypothetical protein HYX65_09120 [Gemmatimonadetes bacterium]|nr:hypothetical protein [Gemmatimonadota bacterium]